MVRTEEFAGWNPLPLFARSPQRSKFHVPGFLDLNVGGASRRRPGWLNIRPGGRGLRPLPLYLNIRPGGRGPEAPPTLASQNLEPRTQNGQL